MHLADQLAHNAFHDETHILSSSNSELLDDLDDTCLLRNQVDICSSPQLSEGKGNLFHAPCLAVFSFPCP